LFFYRFLRNNVLTQFAVGRKHPIKTREVAPWFWYQRWYTGAYEQGALSTDQASLLKLVATEIEGRVADQCLQMFGGYGYMQEFKISRAYVDARIQRIYGGTSEIMKEIIARDLLKP